MHKDAVRVPQSAIAQRRDIAEVIGHFKVDGHGVLLVVILAPVHEHPLSDGDIVSSLEIGVGIIVLGEHCEISERTPRHSITGDARVFAAALHRDPRSVRRRICRAKLRRYPGRIACDISGKGKGIDLTSCV